MKTTRAKILFISLLFSAAVPSILFSAEEEVDKKDLLSYASWLRDAESLWTYENLRDIAKKFDLKKLNHKSKPEREVNRLNKSDLNEADVNHEDATANLLTRAVLEDNPEMAKLLLANGANPYFKANESNGTPLQIAEKQGYSEIIALLDKK